MHLRITIPVPTGKNAVDVSAVKNQTINAAKEKNVVQARKIAARRRIHAVRMENVPVIPGSVVLPKKSRARR